MNISDLRREYAQAGLSRDGLTETPFELFERWMQQAIDAGLVDPTAMVLATQAENGSLSQRIVLLKDVDDKGFVFFTNYTSEKAMDMQKHAQVSLLFPWVALERQIEVSGMVAKISAEDSAAYFSSRPRASQLGALASHQSSEIPSRASLEARFAALTKQYEGKEIPAPDFWGGYRVIPQRIEFWQGREGRLHDRFEYNKAPEGWGVKRLSP